MAPRIGKMSHIVEKPKPDEAASTLAVVGRYLLTASIFDDLAKIGKGAGGEIQLTDGIARLMQREAGVLPSNSRASATIAAASSDTCRPPWSTV